MQPIDPKYDAESLTDLLHRLALTAPSGKPAKAIAEDVGRPYHVLMQELNQDVGTHKLGVELLIPLMRATGSDAPLHYLARAMGGVFVRLPEAGRAQDATFKAALTAVKEFGELMADLNDALADGKVTKSEKLMLARSGQEAVTAIMELLALVAQA